MFGDGGVDGRCFWGVFLMVVVCFLFGSGGGVWWGMVGGVCWCAWW